MKGTMQLFMENGTVLSTDIEVPCILSLDTDGRVAETLSFDLKRVLPLGFRYMSLHGIRWFTISPDIGSPECVCSRCLKQIPDDGYAILRMFNPDENLEARFCRNCEPAIMHPEPQEPPC